MMVPGPCLTVALRDRDINHTTEASVLTKLRSLATPVTLVGGEIVRTSLNVVQFRP
jgi:hypothetical protein